MMKHLKNLWMTIIVAVWITGCGAPKQYGYVIKPEAPSNSKGTALLLHAANNFPIKLISINDVVVRDQIKTSAKIPTYVELTEGHYDLGLSLNLGSGPCGQVVLRSDQPSILKARLEAGKVYLLQRKSKFASGMMCDIKTQTIEVEFYLDELPALPYDDVKATFKTIDLSALNKTK